MIIVKHELCPDSSGPRCHAAVHCILKPSQTDERSTAFEFSFFSNSFNQVNIDSLKSALSRTELRMNPISHADINDQLPILFRKEWKANGT